MSSDEAFWLLVAVLAILLFGLSALWPHLFGPIGY